MASKPPSSDDPIPAAADAAAAPEPDKKLAARPHAAGRPHAGKPAAPPPPDDEDDEEEDELDLDDDDEDDEELVVFTAKEAAGALATVYRFVRPFLKKLQEDSGPGRPRRPGRDAVQRHHAAEPEIPDRRCARRGGFRGAGADSLGAGGGRHLHLDRRGLVREMGRQSGGVRDFGRAAAAVRACPEPAVGLFRADQARRNPLALFHRPVGLRRFDRELLPTAPRCHSWN